MNFNNLRKEIESFIQLFPDSKTKVHEAEDLSSKFLIIQHRITDLILELELDMNEARSAGKFMFHHALQKSEAKNATEKKSEAEADKDYSALDRLERDLKSRINYLKVKQSIFNDAHLVCRTIMREG